jgi:hypothetical protein
MTVQRAYLDYLRLASWHDASALKLTAELRRSIPKWRDGFWLQYRGWYGDNSFYGIGEQNRKRHYVWRSAGPSSSVLCNLADSLTEIYATRIDVQVTIPMPDDFDAFAVYQDYKDINARATTIIESDTGSTVYFGARTSDRFARLYTKEYKYGRGDEVSNFLRLEFEFKGKTARSIYGSLKSSKHGSTSLFQYFLTNFSLMDYVIDWFNTGYDGEGERIVIEKNQSDDGKIEWLHSLSNAIVKMGNDHMTGETTKNLLREWIATIDNDSGLT